MNYNTSVVDPSTCWKHQHEDNIKQRRGKLSSTSISRADKMANECRSRLIRSIQKISSSCNDSEEERKLGMLLSGGVDSCAILAAAECANVRLIAAVTVSVVDDVAQSNSSSIPQDELYAIEAARIHNEITSQPSMKHNVIRLTPDQLIKQYTRPTIETLALWGYMETRNSLIISAALDECQKLGLTDVIVGDNADELFGGSYDVYFHEKYINDPEGWKEKRDSMADLPFVTQKLAAKYNIRVHQSFTDQEIFVSWALSETTRDDCISKCSIQSKFDGPYEINQNCGKLLLREAFCTRASWRRMDWIFAAAASNGDLLLNHYDKLISNDEFKVQQEEYQTKKNVKLQTKEHLHNIRIYESVFGGLVHPTKERYPVGDARGCVSCHFEVAEDFCHLCDQYPARQQAT